MMVLHTRNWKWEWEGRCQWKWDLIIHSINRSTAITRHACSYIYRSLSSFLNANYFMAKLLRNQICFRFNTKQSPSPNLALTRPYQLLRRFLRTASPSMPSWIRPTGTLSEFSCRSRCKLCLLPAYWPTIPWCTQRLKWLNASGVEHVVWCTIW